MIRSAVVVVVLALVLAGCAVDTEQYSRIRVRIGAVLYECQPPAEGEP